MIGSFVPALLWGVAFANIVRGVPIDAHNEYTGRFFNLLNPYALLGGLTTLLLFLTHGAIFIALKTDGPIRERARGLARCGSASAAARGGALPGLDPDHDRQRGLRGVLRARGRRARRCAGSHCSAREGWAFIGTFACHRAGGRVACSSPCSPT